MTTPLYPTAGTTATLGAITFGVFDAAGVMWSFETMSGWGSPTSTLTVTQKPRDHGGWPSQAYLTPRSIVITGTIYSTDPTALATAVDSLNAAVSLTDTTFTVNQPGYGARSLTVRRDGEVLMGFETESMTSFSIQLVAPDPRKYGPTVSYSTGIASQSGGLQFPITYPITFPATVVSGTIAFPNPGNIAAPLILRVDGPCQGPIISHVSSGTQLVFASSLVLATGEYLTIDMARKRTLANGQSSRDGYVTSRGWFNADPGANDIGFNAAVYDASAQLTVTGPNGAWE